MCGMNRSTCFFVTCRNCCINPNLYILPFNALMKRFNIILNIWLMQELLANAMNTHCSLFERCCFGR